MKFNGYKLLLNAALILGAGYFLTFIVYYLANYIYIGEAFYYAWQFIQRAVYLIMPIAAAVIILVRSAYSRISSAALYAIPLAAVRVLYFIPYFYLLVLTEGFDSVEALGYGTLISLVEAAVSYALTMLIFLAMRFVIVRRSGGADIGEVLAKRTVLDFGEPVSLAFLSVAYGCFLYFFIKEIISTVTFISEYGFSYRTSEIIYTVLSYIFDILIPLFYYFVISLIKNRLIETRLMTPSENQNRD